MPSVEHRQHNGLNNCAGNSYQPTRRRERAVESFKMAIGVMDHIKLMKAIEIFATRVAPEVRKAL